MYLPQSHIPSGTIVNRVPEVFVDCTFYTYFSMPPTKHQQFILWSIRSTGYKQYSHFTQAGVYSDRVLRKRAAIVASFINRQFSDQEFASYVVFSTRRFIFPLACM
jgi:hypothetical protein